MSSGKKAESEAPGLLNLRFVAACGSGEIDKVVVSDSGGPLRVDFTAHC